MSNMNKYTNLPGVLVEFKDGGKAFRFNNDTSKTDSILLLGTAEDGPVMDPVAVDESTVELIFGKSQKPNGSPNGATLVKAFQEAYEAGCRDIRLMRVTGKEASVTISAPPNIVVEKIRHDEDLGYTAGNARTEIVLTQKDVILDTVKVYVKGIELNAKYIDFDCVDAITIADGTTGDIAKAFDKVTLIVEEDSCDSGSSLSIAYSYNELNDITNSLLRANENNELILTHTPDEKSGISIKKDDGTILSASQFTIFNNVVKLNFTPSNLDRFNVVYKSLVTKSFVETTDASGNMLRLNSKVQTFAMSSIPEVASDFYLYVDGSTILNTSTYKVVDNRIEIDLDYFSKGSSVSVSFPKEVENEIKREIHIQTAFGGAIYNKSKIKVYDLLTSDGRSVKVIELIKPESKSTDQDRSTIFSTLDFATFGELVEAINTYSGIFKATTGTPYEDTSDIYNIEEFFRLGDDGVKVSKEDMFMALSGKRDLNGYLEKAGAYQLLENYQVDWVVPLGVYADDSMLMREQDFAYELSLFCAVSSFRNKTTLGVIGLKPLLDTSLRSIQSHAKYIANFRHDYFMRDNQGKYIYDSEGNPIDLGKFISVVGAPSPLINHGVLSMRECDPSVMYAALNTTLLAHKSPMNKKIQGTIGLKYSFSNSQLNDIVGNRIVTFGLKSSTKGGFKEGAFVIDAPTSARVNSEYARVTTLKVFREVADHIREVADPFLGEDSTVELQNNLSSAISKRLDELMKLGMFAEYSFNMVFTNAGQQIDASKIELTLRPPRELHKITTVMGLK